MIGKSSSADGKYSRASLVRGGSQEDPVKLMRDLQDSMEREADIREQLKFAEEEVNAGSLLFSNLGLNHLRCLQPIKTNYFN